MSWEQNRRQFFQLSGLAVLASSLPATMVAAKGKKADLTLGMASYSLRKFNTDDTIAMTKRLGLSKICFKSMHLALDAGEADIKATVAKVKAAGLDLYAGGVIYMKSEKEVLQAFQYAQTAEMKMIVGVPNYDLLALCDKKVKETGIMLAIHNHGPGDLLYPSPDDVYKRIQPFDKRIGLCMDIGHTMRIGVDPTEAAKKYFDRLYDVHIKDVSAASKEGKTVEIGRGVINIVKLVNVLKSKGYSGILSLEYEKDEADPLPGAAESIGYMRGVMAAI
jgi:sugar phosphate isomerase/epimerase